MDIEATKNSPAKAGECLSDKIIGLFLDHWYDQADSQLIHQSNLLRLKEYWLSVHAHLVHTDSRQFVISRLPVEFKEDDSYVLWRY